MCAPAAFFCAERRRELTFGGRPRVPGSEIVQQQAGLQAILSKITAVEAETQKLAQENLLLDQYIVNLAHRG